jgi:ferredoxin-thioredoxin reductase catalytic subunit
MYEWSGINRNMFTTLPPACNGIMRNVGSRNTVSTEWTKSIEMDFHRHLWWVLSKDQPARFKKCPLRVYLGMVGNVKRCLCPCLLHATLMSQPGGNYKLRPLSNIADTIPRTLLIALCGRKQLRFEAFSSLINCMPFFAVDDAILKFQLSLKPQMGD